MTQLFRETLLNIARIHMYKDKMFLNCYSFYVMFQLLMTFLFLLQRNSSKYCNIF